MAAYKDKNNGTWFASFYYSNWKGERDRKVKRGFQTKREALEWERQFLQQKNSDLDMSFASFVEIYERDLKNRLKLNTWLTKVSIIEKKILPFLKRKGSAKSSRQISLHGRMK